MDRNNEQVQEDSGVVLKSTDRLLPVANISKIMRGPIPPSAKVAKDSKELMQKSASEFIAIVTCRAKDICDIEARKTITGDDLVRAMIDLDMPYYAELTKIYYEQYRELMSSGKGKRFSTDDINFDHLCE